jgi:hypothetical protein
MHDPSDVRHASRGASRAFGAALAVAAIALVAFIALHPTAHAHDPAALADEMRAIATRNAVVHGALIGAQLLLLLGCCGFAARLRLASLPVSAGLLAHAAGTLAGCGAALINGFVVPDVIARAAEHPAAEAAQPVLALCRAANQTLARADVLALSLAVLWWSCVLLQRRRAVLIAILGIPCAAVPLLALATGHLSMTVHGVGAFFLAQAIWSLAIATRLLRGNL